MCEGFFVDLIIATTNSSKVRELRLILEELLPETSIRSLVDFPHFQEPFAKLATAICEVPAKGRASISTKPIVVTMGEERSELCPRRHEQSAVASFAKASNVYQYNGSSTISSPEIL